MLRILAASSLVVAVGGAAGAQPVYLTQHSANNYALIAPGDASTDITIKQKGQNNSVVDEQNGATNTITVKQDAKNTNTSYVNQFGVTNTAIVAQQYYFGNITRSPPVYTGVQTPDGYLSQFNSGGVSILALTGPGNTLVSSFGRNH